MGVRKAESFPNEILRKILLRTPGVRRRLARVPLAVVFCCAVAAAAFAARPGQIEIVSVNGAGRAGNQASNGVSANNDGSVIGFYSDASNLVPGDTNGVRDVFVRAGGVTERISVSSAGVQGNRASHGIGNAPGLSSDGSIVAFYSDATNLVSDDTNGKADVFVRDRGAGTTERVSVSSDEEQGDGASVFPSVSADGRFVAFQSLAKNLVADDTNRVSDIFVRDRVDSITERLCGDTQSNAGSSSPSISDDGNLVAFASLATNLVPDDRNAHVDVFVCNRSTGEIEVVSVNDAGELGDGDSILPAISGDGRYVAFKSLAANLVADDRNNVVDVFVHDRTEKKTQRVSVNLIGGNANDFSFPPSISNDGRFIAFGSFATNLVAGDSNVTSDVFVRDMRIGVTLMVDVNAMGELANNGTPDVPPAVSGDGMQIGFVSLASNLVPGNLNDVSDVFSALNPFYGPGSCPDNMCPGGLVCVDGFCVAPTPTRTATKTRTPTVTPTPTPTLTPTPPFTPCTDDSQCKPDERCRAGFCKKVRPCATSETCYQREACTVEPCADCGPCDANCEQKLCECGVDCNLDGFVLGHEITKAILILGGGASAPPLSDCKAADINGDGVVTSNEVMAGVTNLSQGCIQEALPSVFGHDRGGLVTYTVGSATGSPGGPVTVSIDMQGGANEVASMQVDVLYDPNLLELGDPAAGCVLDGRLGAHILTATLPVAPAAAAGLRRLRLFVGDVEAPIETIPDGGIATCTFTVKPGVADITSAISLDNLNVGDALGQLFGHRSVSGALSIVRSTPQCAGDCDGDGEVLVTEITRAVLIMSGAAPLSICPAADADGDGEVFVTDVTKAVVNLGSGCPQ